MLFSFSLRWTSVFYGVSGRFNFMSFLLLLFITQITMNHLDCVSLSGSVWLHIIFFFWVLMFCGTANFSFFGCYTAIR